MAAGLTGKYPQIKSGLERILASGPKSNLSVNSELKTVELINTPWTNNAAAETSRIRSLSSLLPGITADNRQAACRDYGSSESGRRLELVS